MSHCATGPPRAPPRAPTGRPARSLARSRWPSWSAVRGRRTPTRRGSPRCSRAARCWSATAPYTDDPARCVVAARLDRGVPPALRRRLSGGRRPSRTGASRGSAFARLLVVDGHAMSTGVWVLVVAVVAALAFGLFRALTDGRFRGTHRVHGAEDVKPTGRSRRPDGEPAAESAARPDAVGRPARRAGDAAAVLLGVLRALPGDPPGPRRRGRGRPRGRAHRGRRRAPPRRSYAASGSCAPRPRWCSTRPAARSPARPVRRKEQVLAAHRGRAGLRDDQHRWRQTVDVDHGSHDDDGLYGSDARAAYSGHTCPRPC